MGLYDRDYYQERPQGFSLGGGGDRMLVTNLVLINVAVYLVEIVAPNVASMMALHTSDLIQPWYWWRLLTAGFTHDPNNVMHIAFNMFVLWMFGRDVEMLYGRREFLRVYLAMIVFASAVWLVTQRILWPDESAQMMGASGAVTGILILFAVNFPRRTILLFFVLPMPAWVLAVLIVLLDLSGAIRQGDEIARSAHLAGAAFAFVYWQTGIRFTRPGAGGGWLGGLAGKFKRRPKLRVHDPDRKDRVLSDQVDRILEKIHQQGEESLTPAERRTLEEASRRYQKRRP